jgi:glycerol uptake facilitator-like aquaporin
MGNIVAQIVGGLLGCAFCYLGYYNDGSGKLKPSMAALCPPLGKDFGTNSDCTPGPAAFKALIAEIVGTFIFVSVVLSIKYKNGSAIDPLNAMTAGGALFCALTIAAPTSGAAINPAVGIAQTVFQSVVSDAITPEGSPKMTILSMWIYIVGPLVGGLFAGIFARFVNESALEAQEAAKEADQGRLF